MARGKQKKFAHNFANPQVLEPGKAQFTEIKGRWHSDFFENDNDIVLELACGRGEYTVGLAPHYPDKNFIGIDIKGDRIWKGAKFAQENGLNNVGFLRTIIHHIEDFFVENEVSDIWIIHPDPRPKKSDDKRRLTHPRFLEIYRKLLKPGGSVRLKTDNPELFDYTLEILEDQPIKDLVFTRDLYASELNAEHHGIVTRYEKIWREQGFVPQYLKFRFAD